MSTISTDYTCYAGQEFYTREAANKCANFLGSMIGRPYRANWHHYFIPGPKEFNVELDIPDYYAEEWDQCYDGATFLDYCEARRCTDAYETATGRTLDISRDGHFAVRSTTKISSILNRIYETNDQFLRSARITFFHPRTVTFTHSNPLDIFHNIWCNYFGTCGGG